MVFWIIRCTFYVCATYVCNGSCRPRCKTSDSLHSSFVFQCFLPTALQAWTLNDIYNSIIITWSEYRFYLILLVFIMLFFKYTNTKCWEHMLSSRASIFPIFHWFYKVSLPRYCNEEYWDNSVGVLFCLFLLVFTRFSFKYTNSYI